MGDTYRNKKNGRLYDVLSQVIDCTNSRDGTQVTLYAPHGSTVPHYVRETQEFYQKFERVAAQETCACTPGDAFECRQAKPGSGCICECHEQDTVAVSNMTL